jgi:hypothetical protein
MQNSESPPRTLASGTRGLTWIYFTLLALTGAAGGLVGFLLVTAAAFPKPVLSPIVGTCSGALSGSLAGVLVRLACEGTTAGRWASLFAAGVGGAFITAVVIIALEMGVSV